MPGYSMLLLYSYCASQLAISCFSNYYPQLSFSCKIPCVTKNIRLWASARWLPDIFFNWLAMKAQKRSSSLVSLSSVSLSTACKSICCLLALVWFTSRSVSSCVFFFLFLLPGVTVEQPALGESRPVNPAEVE